MKPRFYSTMSSIYFLTDLATYKRNAELKLMTLWFRYEGYC